MTEKTKLKLKCTHCGTEMSWFDFMYNPCIGCINKLKEENEHKIYNNRKRLAGL